MPHFSPTGHDMFLCQFCGRDCDSGTERAVWVDGRGNKCEKCVSRDLFLESVPFSDGVPKTNGFVGIIRIRNPKTNGERFFFVDPLGSVSLVQGEKMILIASRDRDGALISHAKTEEHMKIVRILQDPHRFVKEHHLIFSYKNALKSKSRSERSMPLSLAEHCRIESGGLEGAALDRYINRYYGHG